MTICPQLQTLTFLQRLTLTQRFVYFNMSVSVVSNSESPLCSSAEKRKAAFGVRVGEGGVRECHLRHGIKRGEQRNDVTKSHTLLWLKIYLNLYGVF